MKALIVDDSLTVRMDLAEAFEAAGFQTEPCGTAEEARRALGRGEASVLILDVLLPDGDGVELLKELRASGHADLPVLLLSSEAEVRDRIRGLRTGADEYVGKPYDCGYVVARARELVRRREGLPPADPAATTVLLIDDSLTYREELKRLLEHARFQVVTASTGEEGLRLAAAVHPSAVIVDGVLPGVDGPTVIRRLRLDAALRGTPCLLLTASDQRSAELRALEAGADGFVRKEEDPDLILARLRAILRGAQPRPGVQPESLLSPKRLLAVDDSPTYLQEVASSLRQEGYEVVCARSGEEALELLAVQPVDCILLDLIMPGLGGRETCRRIKAAPALRDIPLLLLTALEDRASMLDGLGAGADDYISKSADLEVLRARVQAQLRRRQFEDENRRILDQLLKTELESAQARAAHELARTRAALVEELERKNQELEAFSYSVSHDLRAPLRSIDGFSQMALEDFGPALGPKGAGYLERVRAAAQRMSELIDDLLALSRVAREALHLEEVDVTHLVTSVAAELQRAHPERAVQFQAAPGLRARADPRLLRGVFENLLGNAWKFTARAAQPRVEVLPLSGGEQPGFCVRDNGAGFDPQRAVHLFAPFQRFHSEEEFPGSGIGLATVRRIIDRHGGRVWAESKPEQGATFCITLPASPEQGNSRGVRTDPDSGGSPQS